MVHAARVDIEHFAEIFFTHGGTLDMPAGIPFAPTAVPLHDVLFGRLFPDGEIEGAALFVVDLDARARFLIL